MGHDGEVRIIDTKDGREVAEFVSSAPILKPPWRSRTIDFVDGGANLLLAGGDASVQLRRSEDGQLVAEFLLDSKEAITASCVSGDGLHFAVGDRAGWFAVYSAKTGEMEFGPVRGPEWVYSLAFDPQGARLAVGSGDCTVRIVALRPGGHSTALSHCDQDWSGDLAIGCVRFSPDGKKLLATSFSFHEVRLWNLETGLFIWSNDYGGGNPGGIGALFSADSSKVLVSREGWVVDARSGAIERRMSEQRGVETWGIGGSYAWRAKSAVLTVRDIREGKLVAEISLEEAKPR